MIIVLDSYDCAGKTTLARKLSAKTKIPLYLSGASQKPEFRSSTEHRLWAQSEYHHLARLIDSGVKIDMIVDRWMFTEYCYAPVLRGYDINDCYRKIEKMIAASGNIMWIFPAVLDADVLRQRYEDKKESYLTFKNLLKIKERYEMLFSKTKFPAFVVETDVETVDACVEKIEWYMREFNKGRAR